MAAKDREILALLDTLPPARGAGWLSELTRVLNSDPAAAEQAYAVYARLDELAALPADDPRVEETARALGWPAAGGTACARARRSCDGGRGHLVPCSPLRPP